jgi:hypothetical protein
LIEVSAVLAAFLLPVKTGAEAGVLIRDEEATLVVTDAACGASWSSSSLAAPVVDVVMVVWKILSATVIGIE